MLEHCQQLTQHPSYANNVHPLLIQISLWNCIWNILYYYSEKYKWIQLIDMEMDLNV